MPIQTTAPKFVTTDKKEFATRKEAEAHEAYLVRTERLKALIGSPEGHPGSWTAENIAKHAESILVALSNPLGRKTRGPSKKAVAPTEA